MCNEEEIPDIHLTDLSITQVDEYEIADHLVESVYGTSSSFHLIQCTVNQNRFGSIDRYTTREDISISEALIDRYKEVNTKKYLWEGLFSNSFIQLISQAQIDQLFEQGNGRWTAYYDQYPDHGGIIHFSRPAIINTQDALVYHYILCGERCAAGYITTLEKVEGKWIIKANALIWLA